MDTLKHLNGDIYHPLDTDNPDYRVYLVKNLYGGDVKVNIPWWVGCVHITTINLQPNSTTITFSGCDMVQKGTDVLIFWSTLYDRRNQPSVVTQEDVMRYTCDMNWFNLYPSAMYYTNYPGQGLQIYQVVEADADSDYRLPPGDLLEEFDSLRDPHITNREMVACSLSPIGQRVFSRSINYFSMCHSERWLALTARQEGVALIWRLCLFGELHQPPLVPTLKRASLLAASLCIQDGNKLHQLKLPISLQEMVADLCTNILV